MRTLKITALRLLLEEQEYPDEWWVCIDGNVDPATHCISDVEVKGEVLLMNAAVRETDREEWIKFDYPKATLRGRNYTVQMGGGGTAKGPQRPPTFKQLKLLTALGGLKLKQYTRREASDAIDLHKKNDPNWRLLDLQDLRLKAVVVLSIPIDDSLQNVDEYNNAGFDVFVFEPDYTWTDLWPADQAILALLDCLGILKNKAYRLSHAQDSFREAIEGGKEFSESLGKLDRHRRLILNALKKSIERAISDLEEFKCGAGLELSLEECLEDDIDSLQGALKEAEEELEEARELEAERIPSWREEIIESFGSEYCEGGIRTPTQKQIRECVLELDEENPDWEIERDEDGEEKCLLTLLELLIAKFPDLLSTTRSTPRSFQDATQVRATYSVRVETDDSPTSRLAPPPLPKKRAKQVNGWPPEGWFDDLTPEEHEFKNKVVIIAALFVWAFFAIRVILQST